MLFHSTRGNDSGKDFVTILMQGLADDGGIPSHRCRCRRGIPYHFS